MTFNSVTHQSETQVKIYQDIHISPAKNVLYTLLYEFISTSWRQQKSDPWEGKKNYHALATETILMKLSGDMIEHFRCC